MGFQQKMIVMIVIQLQLLIWTVMVFPQKMIVMTAIQVLRYSCGTQTVMELQIFLCRLDKITRMLDSDGTISYWGDNGLGQSDSPEGTFVSIASGWNQNCAIDATGQATCWGDNTYGKSIHQNPFFSSISPGAYHGWHFRGCA